MLDRTHVRDYGDLHGWNSTRGRLSYPRRTLQPPASPHTTNATTAPTEEGHPVERDKALEMAIGQIEKQFGKGSIMKLGETAHVQVGAIPTGALSLDLALGIGGIPKGRVVEIFGPESSG